MSDINEKELLVQTAEDYFLKEGIDPDTTIDWDETGDKNLISMSEYNTILKIISCEASIYTLRRTLFCQCLSDTMISIRRKLIEEYESFFSKKYVEYNNFY